jgi:hypothetical protein
MIRHFCDVCGVEIVRNLVTNRLEGKAFLAQPLADDQVRTTDIQVLVAVTVGVGTAWNHGDICIDCLHEAIGQLITDAKRGAA